MGIRVPRITLNADFGDDTAFGDLSLLSVGYGLHQAWVYAAMFGTSSIFGTQTYITGMYGSHASLPFLISIVVFGLCLLFASITDQRHLHLYISKKTLVAGAVLMSTGTLLLLAPPLINGPMLEVVSGVMTGIGSAVLILFWGVAFARCDSASIVLNSSIAISIGIGVYAVGLHYGPFPIAGVLTAIIPLLELAILWKKTPAPYSDRNEIPIFKPLPVNHTKFFLRFGVPVFVFGLALGTLRQTSIQYIVPASNVGDQIAMLLAAGFASVVILVTIVALGGGDKWSRYFRPLIPFIAVTLFFLPLSEMSDSTFATMFLVMGYLCFEALMWIFFGELAQRFRLSPIYVFGLGRGMLALAGLAGSLFPIVAANWVHLLPFGEQGVIVIVLLIMVFAYALLPREREIEAIVAPCPLVKAVSLELSDRVHPLKPASVSRGGSAEPVTTATPDETEQEARSSVATHVSMHGVHSAPSHIDEGDGRKGGGRFRAKCETVANTYLLSRRETEIMFFLAKGHNAAYIQEKLYISEGTAKTHIRHVYKKTNVHSQQELMRLVESAEGSE